MLCYNILPLALTRASAGGACVYGYDFSLSDPRDRESQRNNVRNLDISHAIMVAIG